MVLIEAAGSSGGQLCEIVIKEARNEDGTKKRILKNKREKKNKMKGFASWLLAWELAIN